VSWQMEHSASTIRSFTINVTKASTFGMQSNPTCSNYRSLNIGSVTGITKRKINTDGQRFPTVSWPRCYPSVPLAPQNF
jgi:hypothetical protein